MTTIDSVVNFDKTKDMTMRPPSKTSYLLLVEFPTGRVERFDSVNLKSDFCGNHKLRMRAPSPI